MSFNPRAARDGKVRAYRLCTNHHKLGSRVCANKWHLLYDAITQDVLAHFDRITPAVVEEMVTDELTRCLDTLKGLTGQRQALEAERDRLDQELGRLADAVARGGEIPALLDAMESRRQQRSDVMGKLEHVQGVGPDITQALANWQAHATTLAIRSMHGLRPLLESGAGGRQILRQILTSPISVTPEVEAGRLVGWRYDGEAMLGPLMGRVEKEPSNSLRRP